MYSVIAALIPLLSVALASPTPDNNCRPSRDTEVAKYDDLPFVNGQANAIPSPYLGLDYTTFQVSQSDMDVPPPASGDQWTMSFGGNGNISVPESSPKQTFDLRSFSYACQSGVPQPECAISMWGWKADNSIVSRVITYPRLDSGHVMSDFKMNATSFDEQWKDLKGVGFSIARADDGGNMWGGLALDDVSYMVKTAC